MNPGDRIRLYKDLNMRAKVGATGIVGLKGTMFDHKQYVDVIWNNDYFSNGQNDGWYDSSHFEVIQKKTDFLKITREIVGRA